MKGYVAAIAVTISLVAVGSASADAGKQWVCHGHGDDTFDLIDVPTGSNYFKQHDRNKDKEPSDDGHGHKTCGNPEEPPTPPMTGKLQFSLVEASCPADQIGVPGFTVTEMTFQDGEETDEETIFEYPTTCIPMPVAGTPGPAGPAGPAGTPGVGGTAGQPGDQGKSVKRCKSKRSVTITLPKSFKGAKSVTVTIGSKVKNVKVNGGKVKVSFKGIREGSAAVRIKKGKLHFVRQYAVCNEGDLTGINVPVTE